jgi:metal-responsive CopG/Arc/MetJ family transcriptional regulator
MSRRSVKRGNGRKADRVFIGAWIPAELMAVIDEFVRRQDSDRSKLVRRALEEKLRGENREAA